MGCELLSGGLIRADAEGRTSVGAPGKEGDRLLRGGDDIFRTYSTGSRGVDRLRMDFSLMDLTPFGRQEQREDSPDGRPQTPTMQWLRRNDEY